MKRSGPVLALGVLALAVGLSVLADRLLGLVLPDPVLTRGLIFPPHAALTYDLFEFRFTARINSFGFRDVEVSERAPPGRVRVMALGDSFTFGWGVELQDCWLKRVEAALRARGHDVEILDLGAPGFWPGPEADLAEIAIPALRPDVVLVGMLQGDDLRQGDPLWTMRLTMGETGPSAAARAAAEAARRPWIARMYPNISRLRPLKPVETDPAAAWETLKSSWKLQAAMLRLRLTSPQRARYDDLPEAWRAAYEDGRVPIWAMQRLFLEPPNPPYERQLDSPEMQRRIEVAARHFSRIRAAAAAVGASVQVLSVPSSAYANPASFSGMTDIGTEEELATTVPDQAGAAAATRAGLTYKEVTAEFRARALQEPLFYPVDAHFNAEGNRVFAELVTPWVESLLPEK